LSRLDGDTRLRVAERNVWSELGDEVVILDLESSSYLGLDEVAAAIWNLLAEPRTVDELEEYLLATYDVDRAKLREDLDPFLEQLIERGLVVRDEEGGPETA
jgi:hypothetical protein